MVRNEKYWEVHEGLRMNRKEKLEVLKKLEETELTRRFLIPLYESEGMGCKNVQLTHKPQEYGRDIIYYKDDEYGSRIYTAVQVKTIKINSGCLGDISRQINEAFGQKFETFYYFGVSTSFPIDIM